MKNFKEMGVQEMNTQEMSKVDGGLAWYIVLGVVASGWTLAKELYSYSKGVVNGFTEAMEEDIAKN